MRELISSNTTLCHVHTARISKSRMPFHGMWHSSNEENIPISVQTSDFVPISDGQYLSLPCWSVADVDMSPFWTKLGKYFGNENWHISLVNARENEFGSISVRNRLPRIFSWNFFWIFVGSTKICIQQAIANYQAWEPARISGRIPVFEARTERSHVRTIHARTVVLDLGLFAW